MIASLSGDDADELVSAAWLHDIGYSPDLARTGFHPLDGALYLRETGASESVVSLVAYHSAASVEADYLGVTEQLRVFTDNRGIVRDLLWFADMTTGPDGRSIEFPKRMAEVRERYPADHYVSRALDASMPEREAAVHRAEAWIKRVGLTDQV